MPRRTCDYRVAKLSGSSIDDWFLSNGFTIVDGLVRVRGRNVSAFRTPNFVWRLTTGGYVPYKTDKINPRGLSFASSLRMTSSELTFLSSEFGGV